MQRFRDEVAGLSHAQRRCYPSRVVSSRILVDERNQKSLPECRLFVLGLEHRILVYIPICKSKTIFIRPRLIVLISITVCIGIADFASLSRWLCRYSSGGC